MLNVCGNDCVSTLSWQILVSRAGLIGKTIYYFLTILYGNYLIIINVGTLGN